MLIINKFGENIEVNPLMFPDKTSQVWKLPFDKIDRTSYDGRIPVSVTWEYEFEAELIHLNQLIALLEHRGFVVSLNIPYLPYARQDKEVDNELTFAKKIFWEMLNTKNVDQINTRDVHSQVGYPRIESQTPEGFIYEAVARNVNRNDPLTFVFPDHSAFERYQYLIEDNWNDDNGDVQYIVIDKVRDQTSGELTGLIVNKEQSTFDFVRQSLLSNAPKFLIVDDICDGGRTFIETAKAIKAEVSWPNIWLFTTHGIYSKGLEPLFESGINRIFTTDSLDRFRANLPFDFSKLEVIGNGY